MFVAILRQIPEKSKSFLYLAIGKKMHDDMRIKEVESAHGPYVTVNDFYRKAKEREGEKNKIITLIYKKNSLGSCWKHLFY